MSKYIIKNCPVNYGLYKEMCGFVKESEDTSKKCADCTNCVIKQIVEKCKKETRVYRNTLLPADGTNTIHFGRQSFAYDVLQLLDMQEVE